MRVALNSRRSIWQLLAGSFGVLFCLCATVPAFGEQAIDLSNTRRTTSTAGTVTLSSTRSSGTLTIISGTALTPAQTVAVTQALSNGSTIHLGTTTGVANGGTLSITIPTSVAAIHATNIAAGGNVNISALTSQIASTNNTAAGSLNIYNSGGTILQSAGSSLTLNVAHVDVSSMTLSSARGAVSVAPRTVNISNAGAVSIRSTTPSSLPSLSQSSMTTLQPSLLSIQGTQATRGAGFNVNTMANQSSFAVSSASAAATSLNLTALTANTNVLIPSTLGLNLKIRHGVPNASDRYFSVIDTGECVADDEDFSE